MNENDCKPVTKQTFRMPATTSAGQILHYKFFGILWLYRKLFSSDFCICLYSCLISYEKILVITSFIGNSLTHFWPPVQLHVFNEVSKCEQHAPFILTIYDQVIFSLYIFNIFVSEWKPIFLHKDIVSRRDA